MVVVEITPHGKTGRRVATDAAFAFCLSAREVEKLGLAEGTEISEQMLETVLLPLLNRKALRHTASLLKDRDYTERELRRKLREGGSPEQSVETAVQWALDHHYVDDRRYAENYISWHGSGKSRRRLLADLVAKGIDRELAESLLEETPPDEAAQILQILKNKNYDPGERDPVRKRRLVSFLLRRGYSWEEIQSAMRSYPGET